MGVSIDFKLKILNIIYLNKNNSITSISKKSNISYSHCCLIIAELTKENLIIKKLNKNKFSITLTNKGEKISYLYCRILEELMI